MSQRPTTRHASPADTPLANRLLTALASIAPVDSAWLEERLEPVTLAHGEVLVERGGKFAYAYFPEGAVLSVICRMMDGRAAEVGTVGLEGMAGVGLYSRAHGALHGAEVQVRGAARRIATSEIVSGSDARPGLRRVLARYAQEYLGQVAQTAACNALHGIEQRCARWLLMTHDRVGGAAQFPLTQEYLAIMLGVRREGVSIASSALRDAGLIRYGRGNITVVDREGLERAACECYDVARRHFDRLIG